jgi:hypothetical protein
MWAVEKVLAWELEDPVSTRPNFRQDLLHPGPLHPGRDWTRCLKASCSCKVL